VRKVSNCVQFHSSGKQCRVLQQECNIELQTNHEISVQSVNVCRRYSKFCDVTRKREASSDCQSEKVKHIRVQNIFRLLECKLEDVNATS